MVILSRLVVYSSGTLSSTPKSGTLETSGGFSPIQIQIALCFSSTAKPRTPAREGMFLAPCGFNTQAPEAVGAAVQDGGDIAVGLAIENDRLLHDRAGQQLAVDEIVGPRGNVPGVAQIGLADQLLLAVEQRGAVVGCACHRAHSQVTFDP